jgi:endonuclease-8
VIETDDEVLVCFNARSVELLRRGSVRERDFRAGIGPDLTSGDVDTAEISHRARRYAESDTPLVDVLLNQRIAAGVGNVYKSEVLHLLGLNPMRRWGSLSVSECDELFTTASRLLRRNLKGGPRVTRSGVNPSERLWVYRRKGDPCFHCGEAIVTERLGKDLRSTYWCPSCQPAEHESPGADESAGDGASGGGSERR